MTKTNRFAAAAVIAGMALTGLAGVAATTPAAAEEPATYTARFSNTAVGGYDAVSYFDGQGVEGSKEFATEYEGAEYRFSSAENLARFEADPARFAPQYGGYCAWAIAEGKLAPGDPRFAAVHDGKLYLNFNADVQKTWNGDRDGFIARANAQWPSILK